MTHQQAFATLLISLSLCFSVILYAIFAIKDMNKKIIIKYKEKEPTPISVNTTNTKTPLIRCWWCEKTSFLPEDASPESYVFSCGYCGYDNELPFHMPTDITEPAIGQMVRIDRLKKFMSS